MKKIALFICLFIAGILSVSAKEWYVTPTGAGDFSGSSWANADTLQNAINAHPHGDTVYVAAGTYIAPMITDTYAANGSYNGFVHGNRIAVVFGGCNVTKMGLDCVPPRPSVEELDLLGTAPYTVSYLIANPNGGRVLTIVNGSTWSGFDVSGGNAKRASRIADAIIGGGVYAAGHASDNTSQAKISYFRVHDNMATDSIEFNRQAIGGGIGSYRYVYIDKCIVENNTTRTGASVLHNTTRGGGIGAIEGTYVSNSIIRNNIALDIAGADKEGQGGGIGCRGNSIINNCIIQNNQASTSTVTAGNGGGVYMIDGCTMLNCLVIGNKNSEYNYQTNNNNSGGGIFVQYTSGQTGQIINCTIIGNTTAYDGNNNSGAGIAHNTASASYPLNVVNCIVYNNTDAAGVQRNLWQITGTSANNIDTNPAFVAGSYQLSINSPAIGAGDNATYTGITNYPTTDLASNPRLQKTIDIGAYEFQPLDFVIEAGASANASTYNPEKYSDIIIKSTDTQTGQLDLEGGSLSVNGVVKLQKTVATGRWYPLGFPYAVPTIWSHDFESKGSEYEPFDLSVGDDYFAKSYQYGALPVFSDLNANPFTLNNAGKGYTVAFPSWFDGTDISFISSANPTLTAGTLPVSAEPAYQLVANTNYTTLNLTQGIDDKYYYQYDADVDVNAFVKPVAGASVSIAPFEAVITVLTDNPSVLKSKFGVDEITGINEIPANGQIKDVRYYNLQGVEIVGARFIATTQGGVFIKKTVYQSGAVSVSKIIIK